MWLCRLHLWHTIIMELDTAQIKLVCLFFWVVSQSNCLIMDPFLIYRILPHAWIGFRVLSGYLKCWALLSCSSCLKLCEPNILGSILFSSTFVQEICHSLFRTICKCCTKTERWSVYGGKGSITGWWEDCVDMHGSGFPNTNVQVIVSTCSEC